MIEFCFCLVLAIDHVLLELEFLLLIQDGSALAHRLFSFVKISFERAD